MKSAALAVAALALSCAAQAVAQNQTVDPSWTETRFHRVHLRNGNFIDGRLVRESTTQIVLKMKVGEMTVRRDLIDRVEFVKLKHIKEKPIEVKAPTPAPKAVSGPSTAPRPASSVLPIQGTAASAGVPADVREKATEILERLGKAHREQRGEIARELPPLGADVAVYLADVLESLDDDALQLVGPMLAELKNRDALPLLRRAAGSARGAVKAQALVALAPMAEAADADLLVPLLNDPEPAVVGGALDILGRLGARPALEPAVRLCSSDSASLRSRAFSAVIEIARKTEQESELPHLFRDILERAQGVQRAELILQMGGAATKTLSGLLVPYLRDDDAQVRAATAQALGNLGNREISADILNAVTVEREKWARVALAGASVRLVVREAIDPMIAWLEDTDTDVRVAAQRALRGLTGASLGLDPEEWRTWRKENPR